MFEKIYLSVDSKNNPSKELINLTKEKMYEEAKREQRKKHISLYRYSAVAACAFLVISIFVLIPSRDFNSSIKEDNATINFDKAESQIDSFAPTDNKVPFKGNYFVADESFSTSKDSMNLYNYSASAGNTLAPKENIFTKIINFIKNAIQHLWKMLF